MRRLSRELAFQGLFQMEFRPDMDVNLALEGALGQHDEIPGKVACNYAKDLLEGTQKNLAAIDNELQAVLVNWTLERLGSAERALLRLCVYEMFFAPDEERTASAIAINECLELAKKYCEDASPKFINGILGTIVRKHESLSRD